MKKMPFNAIVDADYTDVEEPYNGFNTGKMFMVEFGGIREYYHLFSNAIDAATGHAMLNNRTVWIAHGEKYRLRIQSDGEVVFL